MKDLLVGVTVIKKTERLMRKNVEIENDGIETNLYLPP